MQGDLLSHFLFIIIVDPICWLVNHAAFASIFEGLGSHRISSDTKILQYEDDTLVFAKARKVFMAMLKLILYCFEMSSSLWLTTIRDPSPQLDMIVVVPLSVLGGSIALSLSIIPLKCLGLPFYGSKPSKNDWQLLL